jgi:acyl-CoA reductase-like NAD-dependent aldehyde dehydrogenase
MSFKLTYSTMFDPPAQLHANFDAAVARALARLGGRHALHVAGEERGAARYFVKANPADCEQVLGEFPAASAVQAAEAVGAAAAAWPGWKRTSPARRAQLLRRVAGLIEERVYDIAAALTLEVGKNRMEALGEAQETADFFSLYAEQF